MVETKRGGLYAKSAESQAEKGGPGVLGMHQMYY